MNKQQIFPTILIILDMCASVGYMCTGDIRKVIYWAAASILTICVTF